VFIKPHEKLLGIQQVSTPSTEIQRISTPAQNQKVLYFGVNGTNRTKEGVRGQNPASKKLLGRDHTPFCTNEEEKE